MRTFELLFWLAGGLFAMHFTTAAGAESALATQLSERRLQVNQVQPADVKAAQANLRISLAQLEQFLGFGSSNAERWKAYLDWPTLQAFAAGPVAASNDAPKLTDLQTAVEKFSTGEVGLELPNFVSTKQDAQRLLDLLVFQTVKDPQRFVSLQQKSLVAALKRDPLLLDPRASFAVEQRLDLFTGIAGTRSLQQAVAQAFGRPNLYAGLSERLLNRAVSRTVHQVQPVTDRILGTNITGTGDTTGQLSVTTLPHQEAARLVFSMEGNIASQTLGTNGPACIRSTANTRFNGNKMVQLSQQAFAVSPATFLASTNSQTQSVTKRGGGLGSRIVSKVGRRKVAEQKGQADRIASGRAEDRLEQAFNEQVRQEVSIARRNFEQQVLAPLARRGAEPRQMQFRTASQRMSVQMLAAGRGQLAAATWPPGEPLRDLAIRVHQSAANHWASAVLSGQTLSKRRADQPVQFTGATPDWLQRLIDQRSSQTKPVDPDAFKPWSLTFRRQRPVSFVFHDSQIKLLLHVGKLTVGTGEQEESFTGWDFILRLRPVLIDQRVVLERVGDIEPLPTNFDPAAGRRLRGRPLAVRSNLAKELNRQVAGKPVLPQQFPLRDLPLREGKGQLVAREMMSHSGWLSAGWDL